MTERDLLNIALKADIYLFTRYFFKQVNKSEFAKNWHFEVMADKLNAILQGTHPTNNIIFNLPPRHTKTTMAIIYFTALGFAVNPESEFMHLSSSDMLVNRNVSEIRKIMYNWHYQQLFSTRLANNAKGSIMTTKGGVMYSAPFFGQITGFGCGKLGAETFSGAMLIDDPIKTQDALSETMREKVNFTWANTIISRKNDVRTPVIITAQRTHEHDLCGYLLEEEGKIDEGGKWDLVQFPAILDEGTENERALWEFRMPLAELKRQQELDAWVFGTQYMQDPKPIEGLLFPEQKTKWFDGIPDNPEYIHIQCDPADEGVDYTASVVYYIIQQQVYVVDVIFTQDSSEITIPRVVEQIAKWGASTAVIESNSSWSLFRKEIKNRVAELGLATNVRATTARENKEIRIFNHAPSVIDRFHYKRNADGEYARYLKYRHSYLKMVKDQKDDGVDCDTSACQYFKRNGLIPII